MHPFTLKIFRVGLYTGLFMLSFLPCLLAFADLLLLEFSCFVVLFISLATGLLELKFAITVQQGLISRCMKHWLKNRQGIVTRHSYVSLFSACIQVQVKKMESQTMP